MCGGISIGIISNGINSGVAGRVAERRADGTGCGLSLVCGALPGVASVLLLLLTAVSAPAEASVYQWTDAAGRVHYSDRPPADEDWRRLEAADLPFVHRRQPVQPRSPEPAPPSPRPPRRSQRVGSIDRGADLERRCARLREKIDAVQRKLSRGYREPQGNRLRAQRRGWSEQLYRDCY